MKHSKYHNKKTKIDGIIFDSKREAERYSELKLLERAGKIEHLILQPKFILQNGYRKKSGEKVRDITYIADFRYIENGVEVVEDVKGVETEVFKLKRKIFEKLYSDIDFRLIK